MWDDPTFRAAVYSALTVVGGALVTAIGYIAKRLCSGTSYWAGMAWAMAEKLGKKHLEFVDTMGEEQKKQSALQIEINTNTAETNQTLRKMGSDPAVLLAQLKKEMVAELLEAMRAKGLACRYEEAEHVVERHMRKRSKGDEQT